MGKHPIGEPGCKREERLVDGCERQNRVAIIQQCDNQTDSNSKRLAALAE